MGMRELMILAGVAISGPTLVLVIPEAIKKIRKALRPSASPQAIKQKNPTSAPSR